jgi:eukaryotic-like serine/threonine-protein kinase
MGVVWRARDVVLGREVAVKEVVFPPTMAEEEWRPAQARVLREARASARLNHPGVVTLYDVVSDQGGTFIVMELVEAPTLAELVGVGGPLPPGRVAELGVQLAGALEAAHGTGIVHRDLKPANVMVPEVGVARLADFGVASLQGDPQLTLTGLVVGSPAYLAPEQARGEGSGPAADWWGLGATLFYALEGVGPFDRGSSIATLAAVVNDPPREPRRAGALAPLVSALLAKDPNARPSGPKVRAWLDWLLIVAPSAAPPAATPGTDPSRRPPEMPAFEPDQDQALAPPRSAPVQRPTRQLLPPAPPVPRRAGLRVLGAVALLLIGVVSLLLLGILVARLIGLVPAGGSEDRAALPTTRTSAGANPGHGRAAPASTHGGVASTGTTRPVPLTTGKPATQASRTPATAAVQGRLPGGWRAFTNRAGNTRVGVPPGFQVHTRQRYHATVVEEQGGARRVFTVRSQTPAAPLPQASRDYRAWARRNLDGFGAVGYAEDQAYAGRKGAVVLEYEAVVGGRRVHVSHINVKGGSWGYNVEYIVPADRWDASQGLAHQFEQAFQPLG